VVEQRASARNSSSDKPRVSITSNRPLEVELIWPGGSELISAGPSA
jgi:hypothetical protein